MATPLEDQLSPESINYLEKRPKAERSPLGQFITPKSLRDHLAQQIIFHPGMKVLDPGVGTGEFLKTCYEIEPELILEGWDIDAQVLKVAKKLVPSATLKNLSALDQKWDESFDVVIGNPPYYEIRNLDPQIRERYRKVISGRPNIFSLFFALGFGALRPGGTLAYVVPPSMNNGAFFSSLRRYILDTGSIEFLKVYTDSSLFIDAQTAVQIIVMRKGEKSKKYVVDLGTLARTPEKRIIFSEDSKSFKKEFENRFTLWNLGYEAITGTVVWNKHKAQLRNRKEKGAIPLLWAHNISDALEVQLDDQHPKKPQYIISNDSMKGPAILVNRITGSVGSGSLRCALVPREYKYVGENHVNIIRPRPEAKQLVSLDELLLLLRGPSINRRIQKLTGNTQVSCVELTHFLPVDFNSTGLDQPNFELDLEL